MTLADTSVWIRGLASQEPYKSEMQRLLKARRVVGHEMVFGELLVGDKGGRPALLLDYLKMEQCRTVTHDEVVALVRGRRLHGRGIGWVDAHVLASALAEGHQLWTADRDLASLAREYGVVYEPPQLRLASRKT